MTVSSPTIHDCPGPMVVSMIAAVIPIVLSSSVTSGVYPVVGMSGAGRAIAGVHDASLKLGSCHPVAVTNPSSDG
jgi:hypothetical protein